jgi:hypothetical protein
MTNPNVLLQQALNQKGRRTVAAPATPIPAGSLNDLLRAAISSTPTTSAMSDAFARALNKKEN